MFDFLLKPLGWILQQFAYLFNGSFAWAVFMFTLVVNLLMIPLSIKTQKSSYCIMKIQVAEVSNLWFWTWRNYAMWPRKA